jgi:hypothetical protein
LLLSAQELQSDGESDSEPPSCSSSYFIGSHVGYYEQPEVIIDWNNAYLPKNVGNITVGINAGNLVRREQASILYLRLPGADSETLAAVATPGRI